MVPKSDVWSLGIILIQLAEGVNPYERCSNLGDLRRSVCEGQVPSLQGGKWSPFLMDFVQRCVAKNVEERWSVAELLQGKQAMVFVHSRKDTMVTAKKLLDYATEGRRSDLFGSPHDHERYEYFKARVQRSKNAQLQQLFEHSLAIHHAGMRRSDRNLVEEMFAAGVVKVLCCTSTLAWGVNLPAHGVIIKGTELYDAARGGWVDVDILDVIQIFGRAGRPQFDTSGEGCIIGLHDHIDNFARLMVMKVGVTVGREA